MLYLYPLVYIHFRARDTLNSRLNNCQHVAVWVNLIVIPGVVEARRIIFIIPDKRQKGLVYLQPK